MSSVPSLREFESASRALSRRTIVALTALDCAVYLDCTLRWENGFGFLRTAWLLPSVAVLLVSLLLNLLFVERRLPGWFQGVVAFVGLSFAFLLASSGNPFFDWRTLPFLPHVFYDKDALFLRLVGDGGYLTALLGALPHAVLGRSARLAARQPAPWTEERWLGALGLSGLVVSVVGHLNAVAIHAVVARPDNPDYSMLIDPRDPSPQTLQALALGRGAFWGAVALVGLALLVIAVGLTVRRVRWLERVRKGEVPGFRVVERSEYASLSLAKFWPLPKRALKKVLVRVEHGADGELLRPIAFIAK
jgi:hypothetical protein